MADKIAIMGGGFNPPCLHHEVIARAVSALRDTIRFKKVVAVPSGPRDDKPEVEDVDPVHRGALCVRAFRGIPRVTVDTFDLERTRFARQWELDKRYAADGSETWHVIGADWFVGGAKGESGIQTKWTNGRELWNTLRFVVVRRHGYPLSDADLPPNSIVLDIGTEVEGLAGAASDVRRLIFAHHPYKHFVAPAVSEYIERYGLYRSAAPKKTTSLCIDDPRIIFSVDKRNPKAVSIYERYRHLEAKRKSDANLVLGVGGDGMLLRTARRYWPLYLPILGYNAGHVGYLSNDEEMFGDLPTLCRDLKVHQLMQLDIVMETLDGRIHPDLAFNDTWVRNVDQCAWLDVTINQSTFRLNGDGVLVSTPAGSTGYAHSMGAPRLLTDDNGFQVVGNNVVHPRGWKSIKLREDAIVEVSSVGGAKRPVLGYVDGRPHGRVKYFCAKQSRAAGVELAFWSKRDLRAKVMDDMMPPPQFAKR